MFQSKSANDCNSPTVATSPCRVSVARYSSTLYGGFSSRARTLRTAPQTTLAARWTYQDGQVVKEQSEAIAPAGNAHTEFHIAKPDGWPAGKYTVAVSINGAAAGSKDFVVK